jgi:homocysteine S-methyltransferase
VGEAAEERERADPFGPRGRVFERRAGAPGDAQQRQAVEPQRVDDRGQLRGEAIEEVDARSDGAAAYFMVNCAHPSHFSEVLEPGTEWTARIRGLRANASRMSHAELDEADELDGGNPEELAFEYVALREQLPSLTVLGGCCGTDHRHVDAISVAWLATE